MDEAAKQAALSQFEDGLNREIDTLMESGVSVSDIHFVLSFQAQNILVSLREAVTGMGASATLGDGANGSVPS